MAKLNLLRNAITSNCSHRNGDIGRGISSLLRDSPRRFSTEATQQPPQGSSSESFRQSPINVSGVAYGKLLGTKKHTLKTDIINYLEGCNLTLDDIKVDYNWNFMPMGMMVQFPSRSAYEQAFKVIGKKGRLYKLERAQRSQWDTISPYNGKAVLLQGIPHNAIPDDIDRFLSGYDVSSMELITRQAFPDPIKMAVVRFPSQAQAMNAFITRNRDFCLNNQILVRVLQ